MPWTESKRKCQDLSSRLQSLGPVDREGLWLRGVTRTPFKALPWNQCPGFGLGPVGRKVDVSVSIRGQSLAPAHCQDKE